MNTHEKIEPVTIHAKVKRLENVTNQAFQLKRERNNYKEHAERLAEAPKGLIDEVKLGKLNVRKDFSLMNAHAYASKTLHAWKEANQWNY